MAYFAKVDSNNIVAMVLAVRNEDCLDSNGQDSETVGIDFLNTNIYQANWVKTSYNTKANIHFDSDTGEPDGKTPFRGNYAFVGCIYDPTNDVFYAPRPVDINNISCESWTISLETNWIWKPPIQKPNRTSPTTNYFWDESTKTWAEYTWDSATQNWLKI